MTELPFDNQKGISDLALESYTTSNVRDWCGIAAYQMPHYYQPKAFTDGAESTVQHCRGAYDTFEEAQVRLHYFIDEVYNW
jgi:hypothetical protein